MSSFFTKTQIEKLVAIALEAGEIAMRSFVARDFSIKNKSDNSKVTSADIAVSEFFREKLMKEFPQIPVICEEGCLRESGDEFFLIDPIDGTSSFISGSEEFAINLALVKNNKAIFGLIYAPAFEGGKMIYSDENNQIKINGIPNQGKFEGKLRIITSTRSKDADVERYVKEKHPEFLRNFVIEKLASAVKFFRIVENKADLYLHFRQSMEWDTAAGQALVELSGGKVKKLFFNQNEIAIGEDLAYNKPDFTNQSFISFIRNF